MIAFVIDAARRLPEKERPAGFEPFLAAKSAQEVRDVLKTSKMLDAAAR